MSQKSKQKKLEAKTQKDLENKMKIKKAQNSIDMFVDQADKRIEMCLDKARKAKAKGYKKEVIISCKYAKYIESIKDRALEMKFNFEMGNMMKDFTGSLNNFMQGISVVSEDIMKNKINNGDMVKTMSKFKIANSQVSMQNEMMEEFLAGSEDIFSDMMDTSMDLSNDEIDSMLGDYTAVEKPTTSNNSTLDSIDEILNSLKENN